ATRARSARRSGSVRGCRWTLRAPPWRSSVEFPTSGRRTRPPGAARRGRGAPTARAPGQCTPPPPRHRRRFQPIVLDRRALRTQEWTKAGALKGAGRGAMVRWVTVRRCVLGLALSSMGAGCVVTRLGRGSQVARYFAGLYGAGRTRAQADLLLLDAASGKVGLVTADRRVASVGMFGGSDEEHLEESFNDLARDFARFLVRLSQGQAPKAAP